MKYKPRNSNFDDMQNDFAREVQTACMSYNNALESLKDLVARTIDSYLDAIIKEQLEERRFLVACGKEPAVMFCLGENNMPDGTTDLFYTESTLREILSDIDPNDIDEAEHAAVTALMLEEVAAKFRAREREIPIEQAKWEADYDARTAGTPIEEADN